MAVVWVRESIQRGRDREGGYEIYRHHQARPAGEVRGDGGCVCEREHTERERERAAMTYTAIIRQDLRGR